MSFRGCLQCVLKLLNFVLAIGGVSLIAYSLWMLNDWERHHEPAQPPTTPPPIPSPSPSLFPPVPAPAPGHSPHPSRSHSPRPSPSHSPEPSPSPSAMPSPMPSPSHSAPVPAPAPAPEPDTPAPEPAEAAPEPAEAAPEPAEAQYYMYSASKLEGPLGKWKWPDMTLPENWFIYATLGTGIFTALVAFVGLIGSETYSRVCLSCYTFGLFLLITLQVVVVGGIYLDRRWQRDLPDDPTGQIDRARKFVEQNLEICQYAGLGILGVEVTGLLLALVLRHLTGHSRHGYESDDETGAAVRQPLLPRQAGDAAHVHGHAHAHGHQHPQSRVSRGDSWSARMREKYGLDTTEFSYDPERKPSQPSPVAESSQPSRSRCTIL